MGSFLNAVMRISLYASDPTRIDRNLKILKSLFPFPTLDWRKNTGPLESNLIQMAKIKKSGLRINSPSPLITISNNRFIRSLRDNLHKIADHVLHILV